MPKRLLDEDDCDNGGSDETETILPSLVVSSSSAVLHGCGKSLDDDENDDDMDGRSESSAVVESSASDDMSLPTDGSTDTAEPCSTGISNCLHKEMKLKQNCYETVTKVF